MTLDLPGRLLAERVTCALALACGPALEMMLARHPGSVAGTGLAVALVLLLCHWRGSRRRPCRLQVAPSGVSLVFDDPAGVPVPATGRRARVLGRTVLLHWHDRPGPGASQGTLWITPADLSGDALRALRVALVSGSAVSR
jgi:hypothetical protein